MAKRKASQGDMENLSDDLMNSSKMSFHPGLLTLESFLAQNKRQDYEHELTLITGWDG